MSTDQLETAATALGPLLEEVVFLGGASIHLWLSDPAAPAARATDDVDVISNITSLTAYYRLGARLRERDFSEASDSRVIYFTYLTESALHGYGSLATPRAQHLQRQIDTIITASTV